MSKKATGNSLSRRNTDETQEEETQEEVGGEEEEEESVDVQKYLEECEGDFESVERGNAIWNSLVEAHKVLAEGRKPRKRDVSPPKLERGRKRDRERMRRRETDELVGREERIFKGEKERYRGGVREKLSRRREVSWGLNGEQEKGMSLREIEKGRVRENEKEGQRERAGVEEGGNPDVKYLEEHVFPILLPALEDALKLAQEHDVLKDTVRKVAAANLAVFRIFLKASPYHRSTLRDSYFGSSYQSRSCNVAVSSRLR
ncbi:hypothetical protein AAG570_013790 [Ranatra chinensis]|uniref:Uncharacterized protein n=1 Tax=Ranatra chinensis TaxID=642074 RepID=A0ABD0YDH1_9HEMI